MAAKTTSCFTFLKEALILPTRNPKLFTPVLLLLAITAFLTSAVQVLFVQPFTDDMVNHLIEIKNTDPWSSEYAWHLEATKQDAVIVIPALIIALALGFVIQILAFFAASSTYSGDRYTLAEQIREISEGSTLKGPSITIGVVTALGIAFMAVLVTLLSVMIRGCPVLSVQGLIFILGFLAFLYFTVVALVSVAASVADEKYRGVSALRQAWRLMTRVRRKEGRLLVHRDSVVRGCSRVCEEEHNGGFVHAGCVCSSVWCAAAVLLGGRHGVLLRGHGEQGGAALWLCQDCIHGRKCLIDDPRRRYKELQGILILLKLLHGWAGFSCFFFEKGKAPACA